MEADMEITRDVISDLWPIYEAGEASDGTRALVEAFLEREPAVAATLRGGLKLPPVDLPPSRSAETQALRRTRDLVHGRAWLRGVRLFALAMTALACGRIVQDTTFTAPPRRVIATAITAVVAWAIYVFVLSARRRRALRPSDRT
jgi:uncharacterized membrane protein YccC